MYENFGFLVRRFSRSTERYKTFIRGIWYYYTTGPSLRNVESALNLIGGYPVVIDDQETVVSVTIDGSDYVVVTDKNEYRWETEAGIKVAVGDVLDAFQPLTEAFYVADFQSDPEWFDGTVIPDRIMPGAPFEHRVCFKYRNTPAIIGERFFAVKMTVKETQRK